MATTKSKSKDTHGPCNSIAVCGQKNTIRHSPNKRRSKAKTSRTAPVSSSGSEANAKLSEGKEKSSCVRKTISSSGSSGPDRQSGKKAKSTPKKKLKSRTKKGAVQLDIGNNPDVCYSIETGSKDVDDSIEYKFNETLRWSNVCSDSEEEEERLRLYKENRRNRYIDALHVRIAQKMSGFNQ